MPTVSRWATDIFRIFNQDLDRDLPLIGRAAQELGDYVGALIEDRRRSPGTDLLSDLIAVEQSGDRLSTSEMAMLTEAVLMAGTDTTRNQLACTVALFAEHPAQWELLARRPELAPRAVEESMRYLGAVRATVRFASEDVEYRGVLFPRGTIVSASLAGANRSPGVFSQPDRFDITAERDVGQLGFGSGIHHCLGAALARAELQEALVVLPQLMTNLRLDAPIEWKPPTSGYGDRPGSPSASNAGLRRRDRGASSSAAAPISDRTGRRCEGRCVARAPGEVATVVEVEVDDTGEVKIPSVHTAVDAGVVVNPEATRAQFEGAAVFGTSIVRSGAITAKDGVIEQSNFNDYPVARMNEAPYKTTVHIVDSDAPPAGVGEPGVPPFAPAVCNAIFAATGKRIRELPLSKNPISG